MLMDGEPHQRQRQLLAPPFHRERIRAYGQDIQDITQELSNHWQMGKPPSISENQCKK